MHLESLRSHSHEFHVLLVQHYASFWELSCSSVHSPCGKKFPAFPSNTMSSPGLKPKPRVLSLASAGAGQTFFHGWALVENVSNVTFLLLSFGGIFFGF